MALHQERKVCKVYPVQSKLPRNLVYAPDCVLYQGQDDEKSHQRTADMNHYETIN